VKCLLIPPDWAADEVCLEKILDLNKMIEELMNRPNFDPQIAYELLEEKKKWQEILDMPPKSA